MEVLLIDVGALAVFLGYIAVVYWHGVSHEARPATRPTHAIHQRTDVASLEDRAI